MYLELLGTLTGTLQQPWLLGYSVPTLVPTNQLNKTTHQRDFPVFLAFFFMENCFLAPPPLLFQAFPNEGGVAGINVPLVIRYIFKPMGDLDFSQMSELQQLSDLM